MQAGTSLIPITVIISNGHSHDIKQVTGQEYRSRLEACAPMGCAPMAQLGARFLLNVATDGGAEQGQTFGKGGEPALYAT
jgi:hypothetical protein